MATDKLMNSSQGDDIISALEGIATAIPSINTTTEIPSSQVTAMTGYAKSTSATPGAITTDDTLNEAVGKLEKKVDNNASAIGSLDNASVGLGNVTNNTQVKALSGTVTNGGIVTFGADGSTVADSAKTIETSLSDNNNKIPTSKAVRDNVADVAKLSTYSAGAGTTFKTVSATDTITDAIENVQNNALYNKTNISSMAWTVEEYNYTTTAANTYEYSGVSVTCPAGKIMEIYAIDRKGLATPLAIAITDDSTSITASESLVAENNVDISQGLSIWSRQVTCLTPAIRNSDKNYYIWVKRLSAANNNILLAYRLIN